MNKDLLYLLTILEAIEKIKLYTGRFKNSSDLFSADDQMPFNATLNLLIAVGEESKKLSDPLKATTNVEWSAIFGLRNELSHNYRGVDPDIIWDIIQTYLNPLKTACISMLNSLNLDQEKLNAILDSGFYQNIQYLKR